MELHKRQKTIDFDLCFICQGQDKRPMTEKSAGENVLKFFNCPKERFKLRRV